MSVNRSLAPLSLALAAALVLPGCTPSQGQQLAAGSERTAAYPARLALTGSTQTLDIAPVQPEGAVWAVTTPDRIGFGLPGQAPLLAIACTHDAAGAASLRIERTTRAEEGAKALFALVGNGRIARLPLDARQPGETGMWEGILPAADPRLDVLKGGNAIEATLPGGGTLKLPGSREPGRLLAACRASDSAAAAGPA